MMKAPGRLDFNQKRNMIYKRLGETPTTAEGGEGASMASTAATLGKAATKAMSVAATATTITDEHCARATAINGRAAGSDKVE